MSGVFSLHIREPVLLPSGVQKLRDGGPLWRARGIERPGYSFWVGYYGSTVRFDVAEGYESDGPSGIPRAARPVLWPYLETLITASGVHDQARENTLFSKLDGDCLFLMAMEAAGTPPAIREIAFNLVRMNDSRTRHNPDALVFGDVEMPPY